MKQQDKELLFKDLCSRLPYNVKVEHNNSICEVLSIDKYNEELTIWKSPGYSPDVKLENVKPYLFPLSSMTEEQKNELNEIIDLEVEIAISHIKSGISNLLTGIKRLNWLLKNHFDVNGLIPLGLANDATGLNIY